jgi:hypothetical protein
MAIAAVVLKATLRGKMVFRTHSEHAMKADLG